MSRKTNGKGQETIVACFAIARDNVLTPEEKTLWMLYRSYDSGRGAWPSDEVLAGHMGKSKRSVQSYRASLLDQGFLEQRLRGPRTASYRAVIPRDEDDDASQPTAEHPAESSVENPESLAADCDASVENSGKVRSPLRGLDEKHRNSLRDASQPTATDASQLAANRVRKESTSRSTLGSPCGEPLRAREREGNGTDVEKPIRDPPPMRDPDKVPRQDHSEAAERIKQAVGGP